jgi:DNA-binding transcriptional ArsR family regulator
MRNSATLDALFPTVRAGVLSATLLQPDHWWFMTELARHLEVTPSSLQRELESLVTSGFLLRRQDGRRIYFKANTESPLFPELRGLIEKTAGIIPELRAAIEKFGGRIELAL